MTRMKIIALAVVLATLVLLTTAFQSPLAPQYPKPAAVEVNTLTRRIDLQTGVICYSVTPTSEHLSCLRFPELLPREKPTAQPRYQNRA
jgi:hypothetical protein